MPSRRVPATITVEYDDDLEAGAATLLAVLRHSEAPTVSGDQSADDSEQDAS